MYTLYKSDELRTLLILPFVEPGVHGFDNIAQYAQWVVAKPPGSAFYNCEETAFRFGQYMGYIFP